jgi:hypothetical protein
MIESSAVNLPQVQAAIQLLFQSYEAALMQNDLETLNRLFWQSPLAIRFGVSETLYGIDAIRHFRQARDTENLQRALRNTTITTFSDDFAITTTEFERVGQPAGRQTQTWVRFSDGWRIVSAHVSFGV